MKLFCLDLQTELGKITKSSGCDSIPIITIHRFGDTPRNLRIAPPPSLPPSPSHLPR